MLWKVHQSVLNSTPSRKHATTAGVAHWGFRTVAAGALKPFQARRSLAVWVVAVFLLSACRPEQNPGYLGTQERHGRAASALRIGLHDEPEQLDPGLVRDSVAGELADNMFEGLVRRHPKDLHPVAGMAYRYQKSRDSLSIDFSCAPMPAGRMENALWRRTLSMPGIGYCCPRQRPGP